jgi:hypothetical protein
MGKLCGIILIALFVILTIGCCNAENIYIAQKAAGGNTGADCADAHAASWFNSAVNWVSMVGPIGSGTTVHLCGTISSALIIHGSGSNGSPITILFENGARMSASNWGENGAAIGGNGISYITIDGGQNGIIQATSNGTGLATAFDETAIRLYGCSNCIIRNLTVANMYVHTYAPTDEGGQNSRGIFVVPGSNVSIYHNIVHDTKWCIEYSFDSPDNSNVAIYDNTAYDCDHGIVVGSGDPNATLAGAAVHGNTIYDGYLWDDNADYNHHDGIHAWSVHNAAVLKDLQIYDNYIYGNWGHNLNAFIFMQANGGGTADNSLAFNNLLVDSTTLPHFGCGYLCATANSVGIYNNTIVGSNLTNGLGISIYGTSDTVENNTVGNMLHVAGVAWSASTSTATWDYNNYFNVGTNPWPKVSTFAQWQASCSGGVCHPDSHGSYSNPNLDAAYRPTAQSTSLIQKGVNLGSLSNAQLAVDKSGGKRPSSPTMWTVGAYQLSPPSPTGLTGTVR